mgnify:CR=1 FL=1
MHIKWDDLSIAEWYAIYNQLPKSNIVQTYAYAKAMRQIHFQDTGFGVIKNTGGDPMGLVQAQYVSSFGFKRFFIDRGPLWIKPNNFNHQRQFWELIATERPKSFLSKRRFIPEIDYSPYALKLFEKLGFNHKADGYQTIWLNLDPDLADLEKNLDKSWRGALNKARKSSLEIKLDPHSHDLERLLKKYTHDRFKKKYAGASPKLVRAMERYKSEYENSFIISATDENGKVCAMMYFWIHGTSATYQIGWSDKNGRTHNAHNLMMWRAIEHLKPQNINWLDLGGINTDKAEGVTRFKSGLNGEIFISAGIFC